MMHVSILDFFKITIGSYSFLVAIVLHVLSHMYGMYIILASDWKGT